MGCNRTRKDALRLEKENDRSGYRQEPTCRAIRQSIAQSQARACRRCKQLHEGGRRCQGWRRGLLGPMIDFEAACTREGNGTNRLFESNERSNSLASPGILHPRPATRACPLKCRTRGSQGLVCFRRGRVQFHAVAKRFGNLVFQSDRLEHGAR